MTKNATIFGFAAVTLLCIAASILFAAKLSSVNFAVAELNAAVAQLKAKKQAAPPDLKPLAAELKTIANDALRAIEEMRMTVAELRSIQEVQARDAAETKERLVHLESAWTYRSPILTNAVSTLAKTVHDLEDTYPAENPRIFGEGMHTFQEGLNIWRESEQAAEADAADPHQAMRRMADAVRKYEEGKLDNAGFIEAQADFMKSMELATQRER